MELKTNHKEHLSQKKKAVEALLSATIASADSFDSLVETLESIGLSLDEINVRASLDGLMSGLAGADRLKGMLESNSLPIGFDINKKPVAKIIHTMGNDLSDWRYRFFVSDCYEYNREHDLSCLSAFYSVTGSVGIEI